MGMGYQGFVKFYRTAPDNDPLVVLATSASVNLVLEPIFSEAVWGAGWYNAASNAHYADNAIRYEGDMDFELQGTDNLWDFLRKWALDQRVYPRSLDISPDGGRVYEYHTEVSNYGDDFTSYNPPGGAWNTSLGLSTSEGSFVTVSAGVIALDRTETDPSGGTTFSDYSYLNQKTGVIAGDYSASLAPTSPLNPSGNNISPIPYWRTNAQLLQGTYGTPFDTSGTTPQDGLETVEWNIDLTQNQTVLYTCNGSRLPTALLQGPMEASGSCTLYHPDGVFDPVLGPSHSGSLTSPYLYAENTWFRIEIQRGSGNDPVYIELPAVVVESDDYSLADQSSVTNRSFDLQGLGGREDSNNDNSLPPLIISDSSGSYAAP